MAQHGFGIVGCGMIAEFHTRAINEIPGARVVAACSRNRANAEKIAGMAGGDCQIYDDLDAMLAQPGLDVVCICTPSGAHLRAGRPGRPGGQARRGREAAGDHPAAVRRDHRRLRRRRRPPLHHLPLAVHAREPPAQGGDRRRPVRPPDPGRHLRQVVADPGVLRLRRLARHLGPRRRRRPHEPGHPQRRPPLLADGRRRVDRRPDRHAGPRADRGRRHGRGQPPLQERRPRRDRGRHQRLSRACSSGPRSTATAARPGSSKTTSRSGISRRRSPATTRSSPPWRAAPASRPAPATRAASPTSATATSSPTSSRPSIRAQSPRVDGREGRKSVEIIRAIYQSARTGQVVKLPLHDEVS